MANFLYKKNVFFYLTLSTRFRAAESANIEWVWSLHVVVLATRNTNAPVANYSTLSIMSSSASVVSHGRRKGSLRSSPQARAPVKPGQVS